MLTPKEASNKILVRTMNFNNASCNYDKSLGCFLKDPVVADRDLPAFDRVTMDGIAIIYKDYEKGLREYKIIGTQSAGENSLSASSGECIKIMTGSSLNKYLDTIIPIERLNIKGDIAKIEDESVKKRQFVHRRGSDAKKGDVLVKSERLITPDILAVMASVGMTKVKVDQTPKVSVISTGDELVNPNEPVSDFQIRRSNDLAIYGFLEKLGIKADLVHIKDDEVKIMTTIQNSLKKYDVVILSGGVSKGDYDYVRTALASLGVEKHFHGIKQKPGKPFWFGTFGDKPVFALPGNPVSVYMCMVRYVVPWFYKSFGLPPQELFAVLDTDVSLNPNLTNFVLVKAYPGKDARLYSKPVKNNNSGDFRSMVDGNAFLELPEGQKTHKKGSVYRIWLYKDAIM